jgi:putative ATP-dependent endonuclease of the OLD family
MKISKIKIKNFRSIEELEIEDPTSLCAILWPNSAGKSNVLKAIDLVLGEWWTTKWKVSKELFYNPQEELKIEIYFSSIIELSEKNIKCASVTMTYNENSFACESKLWNNSYWDWSWYRWGWHYISDEFKQKCSFIYIPSQRDLADQMRVSSWTMLWKMMQRIYQNYCDNYWLDNDSWEINRKIWEGKLQEEFKEKMSIPKSFLEADFEESQITFGKFKSWFIENCKKLSLGLANTFNPELDIYDINWFYKTLQINVTEEWRGSQQFNALEVGSGMQNLLLLSIFQTYAELMGDQVIFGIEEPELFLYPNAQRWLYKTFRELSEKTQIFYTTHNPNFLDAAKPEEIIMLRKSINWTEKIEKINHPISMEEEMKIYTHFNAERNEIFFANRVVLVEWPTEKIIFTNLCERLWIDIESLWVSIIECSSKTGVLYFIWVCYLSGIDYFAVWDTDIKKWKDAEVNDAHGNLKRSVDTGCWLEMDDDIEDEIIKYWYTDYIEHKDQKILNANLWSQSVELDKLPEKFSHIFSFIESGKLIDIKRTEEEINIEDIPF